ncbi:MAG: response regulator [Rhizobiales bacterium]|nr:response regulator [Hyphomicrobiales bacterium]
MTSAVFKSLSVLVADDSAYMRQLLTGLLHALGVGTIHVATDGDAALKAFETHEPELVITDAAMKPVDGFTFAEKLRLIDRGTLATVPIIMISGHTDLASIERARDIGISEFLSKPVSPRSLYQRLIAAIDRPRQFIETPTFRGPDRRRSARPFTGPERRAPVTLI